VSIGKRSVLRAPPGILVIGETSLQSSASNSNLWSMALPNAPITLTVQQVEELNKRLSALRHDVNNHLSLIVAAAELIRLNPKPEMIARMSTTLSEQPAKISEEISKFSTEFERVLGITRT
jgi:hypothetical protein